MKLFKPCLSASIALSILFLIINNSVFAEKYWQQEVNYRIDVRLDDKKNTLSAFESIRYKNNSDKVLHELYFHVWPNAYKHTSTAFAKQQERNRSLKFLKTTEHERGYIDSLDFKVNDVHVVWNYDSIHPDICKLILNQPLHPGEEIIISTPFFVKLPNSFSRLGHVGQSYQISQWYPKPAVFDRKGWHAMPYLDMGEFYSEFGSFDVRITLPENYIVGATGDLQTYSEQLFLDSIAERTALIKEFPKSDSLISSSEHFKVLHYKQSMVHDFAWFADKNYNVLKSEVELPHSKRKVNTYVLFRNKQSNFWKDAPEYINDALYYYSLWNGDYPYNQATAVDGALSAGSGMEYPNVTVIGLVNSPRSLETVIMHEVGHNWFYGILGSNEREHPWMDEGLNTFYERRYLRTKYPESKLIEDSSYVKLLKRFDLDSFNSDKMNDLMYQFLARLNQDQAIENHSEDFTMINYPTIVYGKTGLAFRYLEQYLGKTLFDSTMKVYFERWKFRHPYPEDLRAVFEEVSQKNLDWFFDNLINSNQKIDFNLKGIQVKGDQIQVKIENKSEFEAPVFIASFDKQGNALEVFKTDPFRGTSVVFFERENANRISIDPYDIIPEVYRNNNQAKVKGIFRMTEPLDIQLLGSIENRNKSQLYFMPIIGYNYNDKWMPGLMFYNHFIPSEKFEWELVPMYSFEKDQFNFTGRFAYDFFPKSFERFTIATRFSRFSNDSSYLPASTFEESMLVTPHNLTSHYFKLGIYGDLIFKKRSNRFSVSESILMQLTNVTEVVRIENAGGSYGSNGGLVSALISYSRIDTRLRKPNSFKLQVENIKGLTFNEQGYKIAGELNYTFSYTNKTKGLEARIFTGLSTGLTHAFSLDGIGADYKYDYAHLDRSGNNINHFYVMEGGFKTRMSMPMSKSIVALNIKLPAPWKFPIGIYTDLAYLRPSNSAINEQFVRDMGLYIPVIRSVAEIYFPLFLQNGTNTEKIYRRSNYTQEIRLMLNINALNPFQAIRSLK